MICLFSLSDKEYCILPEEKNTEECFCECYKMDQLAIYDIYFSLKLFENFDFTRGGDLLTWYYNEYIESAPDVAYTDPAAPEDIVEEVLKFEKEILKEISGGLDVRISLSDYISNMAQPAWIWTTNYDFPRLYSWEKAAKDPVLSLFNYDQTQSFRGNLRLSAPDFQTFSLPTLCTDPASRLNYTGYCELAENLPDLETTLHLMHLAEYPLDFNENLKGLFS